MQRSLFVSLMLAGALTGSVTAEAADRLKKYQADAQAPLDVRTYPVADLVVPIPNPTSAPPAHFDKTCEQGFQALEQHLRRVIGPAAWGENTSIKPYSKTLSLVVRQTSSAHERIADELSRLRRELDAQAALAFHVITGPRDEIAALADQFPGELGQFETEQLLQHANESKTLKALVAPQVTVFSRQTATVNFDGRAIVANATVAADRRAVRLKVSEGPERNHDLLRNLEVVNIHSGRSVALRFEAASNGGIVPPAPDATERLLVITSRIIVQEEEEQKLVITVTPRLRIEEEEEELLGIPTE